MIDPSSVPVVQADEMLARYVLYSKHIRNNQTIRPEAFMPHPHGQLSVTRHLNATEGELWEIGTTIAALRKRDLYGRGDVEASAFLERGLAVEADPILDGSKLSPNANHANVSGWPHDDKGKQKELALEIADMATLAIPPRI